MCEYAEIEKIKLSNGKTIKEVNEEVRKEVERIYLEGWAKGISIPFKDEKVNIYLANPDGSEDLVEFNRNERSYKIISRVAQAGHGKYAYLLNGQMNKTAKHEVTDHGIKRFNQFFAEVFKELK